MQLLLHWYITTMLVAIIEQPDINRLGWIYVHDRTVVNRWIEQRQEPTMTGCLQDIGDAIFGPSRAHRRSACSLACGHCPLDTRTRNGVHAYTDLRQRGGNLTMWNPESYGRKKDIHDRPGGVSGKCMFSC
jgi:hypothetical protein